MKLGKHQELYRRFMRCLDVYQSYLYSNQEKWMLEHLNDFYDEKRCKKLLYDYCTYNGETPHGILDVKSIEELELKLAIYGV